MSNLNKTISKIQRQKDHGNATMTLDQRKFVREKILRDYKYNLIMRTLDLKKKVIYYANEFVRTTKSGKPVQELRKSTFYDFLREADVPLPKRFKASRVRYLSEITGSPLPEDSEIKIKTEEQLSDPNPSQPKTENVNVETQTDFNNIFITVFTLQGLVFLPLNVNSNLLPKIEAV